MEVRIVEFQETRVAAAEHCGPPELEYETSKKLIAGERPIWAAPYADLLGSSHRW